MEHIGTNKVKSGFTVGEKQLERCWSWAGALLVVIWQVNLPDHDQQRSSRFSSTVKQEALCAVVCS